VADRLTNEPTKQQKIVNSPEVKDEFHNHCDFACCGLGRVSAAAEVACWWLEAEPSKGSDREPEWYFVGWPWMASW